MPTTKTQPTGWKETTLGEVAEVFTGRKDVNQTNPNGKYIFFSCSPELFHSDDYIRDDDAIIIVGNGSYTGTVRFFSGKFDLYQRTYACVLKEEAKQGFDIRFVFYYVKKYFEKDFMGGSRGSSIPYIVRGDIENFGIPMPSLLEQREIAGVLASLDNKIELLRRQNETLEAIARTIFHEWFVEFNFPNEQGKPYKASGGKMVESELGDIPEGWRVGSFSNEADFLNGLALQKHPPKNKGDELPVIKIRELKAGVTKETDKASKEIPAEYIVQDGDLLFSWSGSLEVVIWQHGAGALNQHLFKVSSDKYPRWFLYLWLLNHLPLFRSIAENKATTMGHIQRFHLEQAKVLIPADDTFKKMDLVFSRLLEKLMNNTTMTKYLVVVRDTLLPKLMSVEVGVIN